MSKPHVTAERLREALDFEPSTGVFTLRKSRRGSKMKAGEVVLGSPRRNGYLAISVDRRQYLAHRLAWLHVHGELPAIMDIDHINRIKTDNRIANLRLATRGRNNLNVTAARSDNALGVRGVVKRDRRYVAYLTISSGKNKNIGRFDTVEEAAAAYREAKAKLDPEAVLVP